SSGTTMPPSTCGPSCCATTWSACPRPYATPTPASWSKRPSAVTASRTPPTTSAWISGPSADGRRDVRHADRPTAGGACRLPAAPLPDPDRHAVLAAPARHVARRHHGAASDLLSGRNRHGAADGLCRRPDRLPPRTHDRRDTLPRRLGAVPARAGIRRRGGGGGRARLWPGVHLRVGQRAALGVAAREPARASLSPLRGTHAGRGADERSAVLRRRRLALLARATASALDAASCSRPVPRDRGRDAGRSPEGHGGRW